MPISINVRDMDQDVNDIKAGGFVDVPEGKGLVKIIEFNERAGSYGQDNMKLVLMAWSATRGKGMEHMEGIFHDKPDSKVQRYDSRILRIAIATGVITPVQLKGAMNGVGEVNIEVSDFVGKIMFADIGKVEGFGKNVGKFFTNILQDGSALYHHLDPRCADWPTNPMIVKSLGEASGKWCPAAEETVTTPANEPPANGGSPFSSR